MRYRHLLVASFLLASWGGHAQTIRGIGARPCAEWVQARRDGGRDFWAEQWVLGYLSGVNASTSGHQANMFAGGDDKAVFVLVDAYCQAHAQDILWAAVKALVLQRRAS